MRGRELKGNRGLRRCRIEVEILRIEMLNIEMLRIEGKMLLRIEMLRAED